MPKVILLWVLGVIVAIHRATALRWIAFGSLFVGLLLNAPRFAFVPYRDLDWYAKCPAIRAGELVHLEINPEWKFRYRRGSMESFGPIP